MKRNNKRKYMVFAISFLTVSALCLGVYAYAGHSRAERYRISMSNNYQHAFDELVTAVGEMESALQKSVYASSPDLASAVCTEIFGKAMTAQMSLGVLPFSTYELEQTAGFISRVGDYAFALSRVGAGGESFTEEQRQNLKALADAAASLSESMTNLQTDMLDGVLTMDELYKTESTLDAMEGESLPETIGSSMRLIEQEFPELPALIYDGPFSNHLASSGATVLEGLEEIDENAGREAAAAFMRIGRTRVYPAGVCDGELPCLFYQAERDNGDIITVALSKKGGKVLSMISSHMAEEIIISTEEALSKADDFLKSRGYKDLERSYYMLQGGVLTINYAGVQDGVMCYPDLIKIAVAMDSGEVCGFEAMGYVCNHRVRELPAPAVSEEEAIKAVPEELSVGKSALAIIPTPGEEEILCREFVCENEEGQKFIIYVNAQSGKQEKILILLEDENGSLTL